jgi:hypothetical protein
MIEKTNPEDELFEETLPIRLVVPLGPFALTLAPDLAVNLSRRIKSKSKMTTNRIGKEET